MKLDVGESFDLALSITNKSDFFDRATFFEVFTDCLLGRTVGQVVHENGARLSILVRWRFADKDLQLSLFKSAVV